MAALIHLYNTFQFTSDFITHISTWSQPIRKEGFLKHLIHKNVRVAIFLFAIYIILLNIVKMEQINSTCLYPVHTYMNVETGSSTEIRFNTLIGACDVWLITSHRLFPQSSQNSSFFSTTIPYKDAISTRREANRKITVL